MTEQRTGFEPQTIPARFVADLPQEQRSRLLDRVQEDEQVELASTDVVWVFPEARNMTDAASFLLANTVETESDEVAIAGGVPPDLVWASFKRRGKQSTEALNGCIDTANGDLAAFNAWFRFGTIAP